MRIGPGIVVFLLALVAVVAASTFQASNPASSEIAAAPERQTNSAGARPGAGADEAAAYVSRVLVGNLKVSKSIRDETAVSGEVENIGDRTVTDVEIKVHLLGAAGKPVYEIRHHPVRVTEASVGRGGKPLKPGQRRKFVVEANGAPSNWAGGVSAEVVAVEFENESFRPYRWLTEGSPVRGSRTPS